MNPEIRFLFVAWLSLFCISKIHAGDFFTIHGIEIHQKPPKGDIGIWKEVDPDRKKPKLFVPSVEVKVEAAKRIKYKDVFVHLWFYDANKQLVEAKGTPSEADHGRKNIYAAPIFLVKGKVENFFFEIPEKLVGQSGWNVVAVFGDDFEAAARAYPQNSLAAYDFPEKKLVGKGPGGSVERAEPMDPVISHVVKTGNPKQPQITLFLCPPSGMRDGRQVKGVLAMCMLAENVEAIRRRLQRINLDAQMGGIIGFAQKHQLAILAWGSRSLWNPNASYDEQTRHVNRVMDESFDEVANAWANGVKELGKKYGVPQRDFLLWGQCGSAQWAHRLALRKPDYFLAVHVHIPGSFDQPTPEANKPLWLLTTGELYGGYERSKRFYSDCRKLGYPMIYKAIVGLGHAGSAIADKMGLDFFEYALSVKDDRDKFDEERKKSPAMAVAKTPWVEVFRAPPFYGDLLNQEYFPADQVEMIPESFRVPLPTQELAEAWNK
ncbi:MAG: hypothetical protein PHV34_03280 [Verrucomicrobiae bacterium]|nr:hypothetical protein [Verrucomicrobiae bacterium]